MFDLQPQIRNRPTKTRIQPDLEIGQPGDKYEMEADAVAEKVMRMSVPTKTIHRKCEDCEEEELQMSPLLNDGIQMQPVVPKEKIQQKPKMQQLDDEEEMLQAKGFSYGSNEISSISSELIDSKNKGNALSDSAHNFMSNAFGVDFSDVKVHTDSQAVQMNQELGAKAFAHGNDIYFNNGEYNPESTSGKELLAHELTHTIQQSNGGNTIQRYSCRQIINTDEGERVNGINAHSAIINDFKSQVGNRAKGFRIPGATSLPIRLPCGDTPDDYIPPSEFIDQPRTRANVGIPDLAYVDDNRNVHLGEIKIGIPTCLDQAERQVGRYVDQANMDDPEMQAYKNSPYMRRRLREMGLNGGGLENFVLMNPSAINYSVPDSLLVDGTKVNLGVCDNGVIVYKNIGESSEDRHLCDEDGSDFIDSLMDRAENMVDDYIDRQVDRLVSQAINTLSLEDMITLAYEHARPAIRQLVVDNSSETAWSAIEAFGDEQAVSALAAYLQNQLGESVIGALRPIINQAKSAVLNLIRERMKAALRPFVQQILQGLCSENAAVAVAMALQMIQRSIGQLFQNVLNQVIQEAVIVAVAAMVITTIILMILVIIAVIVIVVIIVLALPEILAALGIGGAGATVAGGTAAVVGTTAAEGTILTTGVTATGVTLTVLPGGAASATTVAAVGTASSTEIISAAAAALIGVMLSSGNDSEQSPDDAI